VDNIYTLVGELLLRQHFVRAYHNDDDDYVLSGGGGSGDRPETTTAAAGTAYQHCSDYLVSHRLTLSFEVVTSFLGDHGERPHRDFLILTSVADRHLARFYSTSEIIELAQRFRLPHNDCWIFRSSAAVQSIFDVYDQTRETGTAASVLPLLTNTADRYIASMYPHDVFQGDILEGVVIRFVPASSKQEEDQHDTDPTARLAEAALHLLNNVVPVSQPDGWQLSKKQHEPEAIDLRTLCQESESTEKFEQALRQALGKSTKQDQIKCFPAMITEWATSMKQSDNNKNTETQKIATLLINLTKLTSHVSFTLQKSNILIIHVMNDATFLSFERQRGPGELSLFRGFSIELLPEGAKTDAMDTSRDEPSGEPLMLKMKFLPYMVRFLLFFSCSSSAPATHTYISVTCNRFEPLGVEMVCERSAKVARRLSCPMYRTCCVNGIFHNRHGTSGFHFSESGPPMRPRVSTHYQSKLRKICRRWIVLTIWIIYCSSRNCTNRENSQSMRKIPEVISKDLLSLYRQ
jgi:hypothetical protein